MSEGRTYRESRLIPIILIILNLLVVAIAVLKTYNINLDIIYMVNELDIINISTFLTLFIGVLIITSIKIDVSEEARILINKRMSRLQYLNIALLIILLIIQLLIKDKIVTYAMINIEIEFLAVYLLTRKGYAEELRFMRNNYDNVLEKERPDFSWIMKFWFSPYERVKFKDRLKCLNVNFIVFMIIAISVIGPTGGWQVLMIFFLFSTKDVVAVIEIIIPLQVSTKGVLTDIEEKTVSKSNQIYYRMYITDYENKKEVIVDVNSYPLIATSTELTVVHGMFSKKALYVKDIKLDVRG